MEVGGWEEGREVTRQRLRGGRGGRGEGGTETPLGPVFASPALFWYVLYTSQQMEDVFSCPFVFMGKEIYNTSI